VKRVIGIILGLLKDRVSAPLRQAPLARLVPILYIFFILKTYVQCISYIYRSCHRAKLSLNH
jgi:hypothetical protein